MGLSISTLAPNPINQSDLWVRMWPPQTRLKFYHDLLSLTGVTAQILDLVLSALGELAAVLSLVSSCPLCATGLVFVLSP